MSIFIFEKDLVGSFLLLAGEQKLKAFQLRKAKFLRTSGLVISAKQFDQRERMSSLAEPRLSQISIVGLYAY